MAWNKTENHSVTILHLAKCAFPKSNIRLCSSLSFQWFLKFLCLPQIDNVMMKSGLSLHLPFCVQQLFILISTII